MRVASRNYFFLGVIGLGSGPDWAVDVSLSLRTQNMVIHPKSPKSEDENPPGRERPGLAPSLKVQNLRTKTPREGTPRIQQGLKKSKI